MRTGIKVPLDVIPKDLQNAFIAVEDDQFRHHYGIDFRGILRALWTDIKGEAFIKGRAPSPNNWPGMLS